MIVGPIVSAKGEKKETLSFFKVHRPGFTNEQFEWIPSFPDFDKYIVYADCDVPAPRYKLNIGGELQEVYPGDPPYCKIVGGTTYVLGDDFFYEGNQRTKTYLYETGNMQSLKRRDFSLWGTFTFFPESIFHDIDGTFEIHIRYTYYYDTSGKVISFDSAANGHGTGDLKGVTMKAELGPRINGGYQIGWQSKTLEGTIKGWPTHLNTPPRADIYIEHPYRGDLIVDIGVGDPFSPTWSQRIWYGQGGEADDLDLTVDLASAIAYLPPDGNQ